MASASTTEQINDIICKYQNPTVANKIEGFGFLLSTDIFPDNMNEISSENMTVIVRRLNEEHDQLMRHLKLQH